MEQGVGELEISRMSASRAHQTSEVLKGEVRKLGTYEDVIAAFRRADKNGDRALSMAELHRLMSSMNNKWTEMHTHNLFRVVDRDTNGELTIEEFLGFVFSSNGRSSETPYEAVLRSFVDADLNHNGVLDKREFHRLMSRLQPNEWQAEYTNQVFAVVDKDGSGEVDSAELIGHIFGAHNRTGSAGSGRSSHRIVIQFVHGSERKCEGVIGMVEARWKSKLKKQELVIRRVLDEDVPGINKVMALSPQRVIFWDKPSMIPYREDPFATEQRIFQWADEMLNSHFPLLAGRRNSGSSTQGVEPGRRATGSSTRGGEPDRTRRPNHH